MKHRIEAAEALINPPSCVSGFDVTALPPTRRNDLTAAFSLACKSCKRDVFHILAHPVLVPDPSPYYAMAPGETFHRPPHRLRCASCHAETALFDGRTQGYDGVLNDGFAVDSGSEGEAAIPGQFKVSVAFYYNIERDELLELSTEANVIPSDLFDAISIVGDPAADGGIKIALDYECA
jgi:hypothetical protein